ncbi:DNA-binding protein [Clostridia bacterium]|nr:DNA-binding protein [Clostridia bacterium]
MNVLLDTNIVIDALENREPFNRAAQDIILLAAEHKIDAHVTATSVTDIYYLLRRHLKDRNNTREAVRKIIMLLPVLDVTASDCDLAFDLSMHDYEDAVLAQCAKRHKVDCIVTRNEKDYVNSPVTSIHPDVFVKRLAEIALETDVNSEV